MALVFESSCYSTLSLNSNARTVCENTRFQKSFSGRKLFSTSSQSGNTITSKKHSGNLATHATLAKESYGGSTIQGPKRTVYEDALDIEVDSTGKGPSFFGVYDGHGGTAVAKFLEKSLWPAYKKKLTTASDPVKATFLAFQEVDAETIAPPKGFFGMMREHGMGGSKCGSTAATLVLIPGEKWKLLAANVGDSRGVLGRGGKAVQITVDHKPDIESERKRIEAKNPTPGMPLVRNINGTWRVGGLLALSRAFGDVYLKDWSDGLRDGARGGFGLTAEPSIFFEDLQEDDSFVILGTDGLWDFVPNQEAVDFCLANQDLSSKDLADKLLNLALGRGATDDVTVIVVKLPQLLPTQ